MYKVGYVLCALLYFGIQIATAQFFDDFQDPDLGNRYLGNIQHFRVNANTELQLNAPVAGSSYLSRPVTFPDSIIWEFYFRLEFDPSASNRLRIWLSSTSDELETGDGVYLEIGESGNNDAIRLFTKSGNSRLEIASATPGRVAFSPAQAAVRCSYNSSGVFTLAADYSGSDFYGIEFQSPLNPSWFSDNRYFGIHCTYTETRRNHFYFDRFLVDEIKKDTIPPRLLSWHIPAHNRIQFRFNEDLNQNSISPQSIVITPSISIQDINLDSQNPRLVDVLLESSFQNLENYHIQISKIEDISGNSMRDTAISFQFLQFDIPDPFDLIFSELMVRPNPPQGLPAEEYIELYNRSDKVLQLADFSILDGNTIRTIDSIAILPGDFVLLTSRANQSLFQSFGKIATMPSFPSLTDSGKKLAILYDRTLYIDWIEYSDTWYGSASKSSGGYSLELINPNAYCSLQKNWTASNHPSGGTPGSTNSVWKIEQDTHRVSLVNAYPLIDGAELLLNFDKKLNPISASNPASFSIQPNLNIQQALWSNNQPIDVRLILSEIPDSSKTYIVKAHAIEDCQELRANLEKNSFAFSKPVTANPKDVVINEILFQFETGGSRFIELYNNSSFFIDLARLFIIDFSSASPGRSIDQAYLLKPQGYVALTPNPEYIIGRYLPPDTALILRFSVPTLSDRSGNVSVYNFKGTERIIIDSVDYDRSFHYPLLADRRGVSIERLNPQGPSNDRNNWYSAAESVGYATPGYQNSQWRGHQENSDDHRVQLLTPYFSPNQDGFLDFMELAYQFDRPGFVANLKIFNAAGQWIKDIATHTLLPQSGTIIWDGTDYQNRRVNMGIYLIFGTFTHPDGEIISFKKDVTVAVGF